MVDFRDEYPMFCAVRTSTPTSTIEPAWARDTLSLFLGSHLGYGDITQARGLLGAMEAQGLWFVVVGGVPESDILSGRGTEATRFLSPRAVLHPRCVPVIMEDLLGGSGSVSLCFFFGPRLQKTHDVPASASKPGVEYFRVAEADPGGDGSCSGSECPCGYPGVRIPRGSGYLYVSQTVIDFRQDARTATEARHELADRQPENATMFLGQDVAAPILMCERGARKWGLDLDVAAADAAHWWKTGMVPLRVTPLAPDTSVPLPSLLGAAESGETRVVESLLAAGVHVEARRADGCTALMLAASTGHIDTVESLLGKGAKVNVQDDSGSTALILAARNGHRRIVERLLDKGAAVDVADEDGDTALILAASRGLAEVVDTLVAHGADVNARNAGTGNTALILACNKTGRASIVDRLLAAGASVNVQNSTYGNTALICAANWGRGEIVHSLLAHGADPRIRQNEGDTAEVIAKRNGHTAVVASLVAAAERAEAAGGESESAREPAASGGPPPSASLPAWIPTHLVPPGGMTIWDAPDSSRTPTARLQEGLALVVEATASPWAQVRAGNGWQGWVDGRLLRQR